VFNFSRVVHAEVINYSTFFREALRILRQSELQAGARARTAFALATVLDLTGDFEGALNAREFGESQILQLPDIVEEERKKLDRREVEFDKFVLFCHR
jgi:hypothetical protein